VYDDPSMYQHDGVVWHQSRMSQKYPETIIVPARTWMWGKERFPRSRPLVVTPAEIDGSQARSRPPGTSAMNGGSSP